MRLDWLYFAAACTRLSRYNFLLQACDMVVKRWIRQSQRDKMSGSIRLDGGRAAGGGRIAVPGGLLPSCDGQADDARVKSDGRRWNQRQGARTNSVLQAAHIGKEKRSDFIRGSFPSMATNPLLTVNERS